MQVIIKCGSNIKDFNNKTTITISGMPDSDFVVPDLGENLLKLVYSSKYNNFVLVNSSNNKDILFNNKAFSKVLVTPKFTLTASMLSLPIDVMLQAKVPTGNAQEDKSMISANVQPAKDLAGVNDIEKQRITIIKEIGYKILELKNTLKTSGITSFILNVAIVILSVVVAFGITNYLFGFKIDNSSSVLNLSTNPGFLAVATFGVLAVSLGLKQGIFSYLEINKNKRLGESDFFARCTIASSSIFMLVIYAINLLYYKSIPGFTATSFFIALLFVGALVSVTVSAGYLMFRMKHDRLELTNCEYREDFETVMKNYRKWILSTINGLSANKINAVKSNLVNNQLKAVLETFVGILTAPFLAYGVSNTLASCFPEAANWVRISGLRFSPIFLVLATFLIIFAFFSFVRAFTIGKQIKGSEIIKFDGFHDYNSHGVTVLGIDSMRSLEREKRVVMYIACFIILIEFTMNVSYFITEIGGDVQGMFLSIVTALVPTALLIAETHMLSDTMYKIHNYNDLLSSLD